MTTYLRHIVLLAVLACLLPACGGGGDGTLNPKVAPGIPLNVQGRPGNRSAKLNWVASTSDSTFTVLRSLNSRGPFKPVSVAGQFEGPTAYVDTSLTNGTTYYYSIVESNPYGTSLPSLPVAVTPAFKAVQLSCKHGESLAVLPDGSVWRWGTAPARVEGLAEVSAVSSGGHTLALTLDGEVWGWGDNQKGQLGSTAPVQAFTPVKVAGVEDIIAVAAGIGFSLALTADGRVLAWGANGYGTLGQGTNVPNTSAAPLEVPGLTDIIAISAGETHALALRSDGLVFSWGTNFNGVLGNPPAGQFILRGANLVENLTGVVKICAGKNHSMALRNDGTIWSWGYNIAGAVGIGNTITPVVTPTQVLNLNGIVDIAAGGAFSLAVRGDGTVWSWGSNMSGQLGNGVQGFNLVTSPTQVLDIQDAVAVQADLSHSYALGTDGTVYAWGSGSGLGTGGAGSFVTPVELPNFTGPVKVGGTFSNSFLLRSNGTMWGLGTNDVAQLGNGTYDDTLKTTVPEQPHLPPGSVVTAFGGGEYSVLALLSTGVVYFWGGSAYGELGVGSTGMAYLDPVPFTELEAITAIACGWHHCLAVRTDALHDGTVWTWGRNHKGQLGNGSFGIDIEAPTEIPNFSGVVWVAGNESHSLAVKSDGTVWSWGNNASHQLGLGAGAPNLVPTPTQVAGIPFAVAAVAGQSTSAVLCQDGTVWVFGGTGLGSPGTSELYYTDVPIPMPGLSGAKELVAGRNLTAALLTDGTVWAWGQNAHLGNATAGSTSLVPVQVQLPHAAVTIGSGDRHTQAILTNGTVWGWGSNTRGQLGIPVPNYILAPIPITQ